MTLLIDAGNTFLKWAHLEGEVAGTAHSVVHHGVDPAEWQDELAAITPRPRKVVVANVAGAAFAARLRDWVYTTWQLEPQFPVATRAAAGVTNAYVRPEALGIDRWLGMIAAWHEAHAPLLCASAGTAFTIDLIDATGMHRGGCIVPGARLMRESLHAQTSDVAAAALLDPPAVDGGFGVNTAGAVQQGARLALASLADRMALVLEKLAGTAARVFLTGGAAPQVGALMTRPVEQVPDLVLRGLALLLRSEQA
ncbi:MAG TPA: type III pantothenate kinase [Steroidobacteraceae bacterium]|nr:type III pantothenate kinase [Steroidobacteraceae bacterium]